MWVVKLDSWRSPAYTRLMCGRYRRKSDRQRIAEAFAASVGLEEIYLGPEDDIAPQSMQPVVIVNQDGERQMEMMPWAL